MILSLTAAAALAALSPADEADLHCIAIFAMSSSQNTEEKDAAGFVGAMMYYLGRVEGRSSAFDLESHLTRLLSDASYTQDKIQADATRCGTEMETRGAELQKVGNALQRVGDAAK